MVSAAKDRLIAREKEAERLYEIASNRDHTIDKLGKRLLSDNVKWVSAKLTKNNLATSCERIHKVAEFCRKSEYEVENKYERELIEELHEEYKLVLRREFDKEEQARIKAIIREEKKAEQDLEREMRRIESEKDAIQKALDIALKKATDEHSEEVERLRQKLLEAEEKAQRAKSMAQLTKAGHIYVISNIGSFGEDVFKIGMTRRLEPMDRVKELGDASVPFPFDVHMMISCDDAPTLENTLHRALHRNRLNKINTRKEFFRSDIEEIRRIVEEHHGEVSYVASPEALQYRESLDMSDDDYDFITEQFDAMSGDNGKDRG